LRTTAVIVASIILVGVSHEICLPLFDFI
jgi:hypothetical protein